MSRKNYPAEYREQIVKLARAGRSAASLAREFEPTEPTIRSWIAAANGTGPSEDVGLRHELRQVKRQLARVEEEKAILQRPRPGSPRKRSRPPTGLRVHKGASGRIFDRGDVPPTASLPWWLLCLALSVTESTVGADQALLVQIKTIHAASREVYGAPRIHATLRERWVRISRRRVARLMLQQGLRGVCRRRRKGRLKRTGTVVLAPDQVRRSFQAARPNQLWVADATYIPTSEGTLYLAAIQDVSSRRAVGLVHVPEAGRGVNGSGLADGGAHAPSPASHSSFRSWFAVQVAEVSTSLRRDKREVSMGSVGDCFDNAMAESLFATLETELIDREPRQRFRTRAEVSRLVFTYLEGFYSLRQIHSALHYQSSVSHKRR